MYTIRMKSHHDSTGLINKYFPDKPVDVNYFNQILNIVPDARDKAIYVHTPFCDKICSFCNLNRKQLDGSLDEYTDFIVDEFNKYGQTTYFKNSKFKVIFFGGGTPTVYNPIQLEKILVAIKDNVSLTEDYEFTFETTLHNLTSKKIEILQKYGVNRLSIGIQSFSDRGRVFYNRTYSQKEVIKRLEELKKSFVGDVCIDIIYNFPNQQVEEVIQDAKIIKQLQLSSSSFYSLMVHQGSKLSKDVDKKEVVLNEDVNRDYQLFDSFLTEVLNDKEYHLLELTKVARKTGDKYQYIQVRNSGGDTFPIGNGAGGNVQGIGVFRMNKQMSFYSLYSDMHIKMSRLGGIMQFPKYSKSDILNILSPEEYEYFYEKMKSFQEKELVIIENDNFSLTKKGVFWGNNMIVDISTYILENIIKSQQI